MNDDQDKKLSNKKCLSDAEHGSSMRTHMLRVKSNKDNTDLLQRITELGGKIVSEGKGVIVIEADANTVTALSEDEEVLAIQEERKLEMRASRIAIKPPLNNE